MLCATRQLVSVVKARGVDDVEERSATADMRTEGLICMVNDNDNDNDTLREVPHPSNEGLALQARVKGS